MEREPYLGIYMVESYNDILVHDNVTDWVMSPSDRVTHQGSVWAPCRVTAENRLSPSCGGLRGRLAKHPPPAPALTGQLYDAWCPPALELRQLLVSTRLQQLST